MNRWLNRVLKAYQPLYQRGLLMDGPCRWPRGGSTNDQSEHAPRSRRRMLLVALTGWRQIVPCRRGEP